MADGVSVALGLMVAGAALVLVGCAVDAYTSPLKEISAGLNPEPGVVVEFETIEPGHPYSDYLGLDALLEHLFIGHFEVWNMLAASESPTRLRTEHEREHGIRRR